MTGGEEDAQYPLMRDAEGLRIAEEIVEGIARRLAVAMAR
jgi:hypothetical protein